MMDVNTVSLESMTVQTMVSKPGDAIATTYGTAVLDVFTTKPVNKN